MKVIKFAPFFVSQQFRCYLCPARLSPALGACVVVASVTEADPQERSARHSVWFGSNNRSAQLKNISIIIPSFAILILAEVEGKINGFNVPFVSGRKEWIWSERVSKKR